MQENDIPYRIEQDHALDLFDIFKFAHHVVSFYSIVARSDSV